PAEVVAERYGRLVAAVEQVAFAENQALVGGEVDVLVAEGEGRKDGATHRMSGRAKDNRLVHFMPRAGSPALGDDEAPPRPGDMVVTTVTSAAPHYLIADGAPLAVRRTPGGDAWQARADSATLAALASGARPAASEPVLLGMPALFHDRGN